MKAIKWKAFLICVMLWSSNVIAQDFQFIKATSQTWSAGVRGGGRGINYEIHLLAIKSSKKISFDSLKVKDRGTFPLHVIVVTKDGKYQGVSKTPIFSQGDTIKLKASYFTKTDFIPKSEQEKMETDSVAKPAMMNFTGEALITYRSGKKKKTKGVDSFEKLPNLNYP